MNAKPANVDIYEFAEYRVFLDAYYRARRTQDPKFSHRYIAAQVRSGSAGWFADILKGRTNLSATHRIALVKMLGLKEAESAYFECLVNIDQAGSVEEKNIHFKRLLTLKGVKPELIGSERFEYYSEWYHSVIRELLFFHDFKGDYAELSKMLRPPIQAAEARKSIRLLEGLGFIKRQSSGTFRPVHTTVKKDPAFRAMHFANFMKANTRLGIESLETLPKEERDISTMTLSLSSEGFLKAKEEIRMLRERLLALTQADKTPDRVYQFNFHGFPVTK